MRLLAFAAIFALFQWVATSLHSDRGQAGVLVALLVVSALVGVEALLLRTSIRVAARSLGLGLPSVNGLVVACVVCAALVLAMSAVVVVTGTTVSYLPTPPWHLVGLFAQAGIAEETLFRGYLFGNMRRRLPFWRACFASMIPFAAVHLWLFLTLPWPIALASIGLAVATSVPLAQLYELGGRTIWPAAMLHFTIQTVPKVVATEEATAASFALAWMAVSGLIPFAVLWWRRPAYT